MSREEVALQIFCTLLGGNGQHGNLLLLKGGEGCPQFLKQHTDAAFAAADAFLAVATESETPA